MKFDEMKILLTTLNSKYVHSNPALKYLYTVTAGEYSNIEVREFTINNTQDYIFTELIRGSYDMLCFSCYVWNIEQIRILAADLKKARPDTLILLGGPEVSFNAAEFMRDNPWVDFIICGEGEYPFYRLCEVMKSPQRRFDTVPGLIYRQAGKIFVNEQLEPIDFNAIPFIYSMLDCESDRVVYYESSRGCPFGCTYCLSAAEKNVRSLNMDRVKGDLGYFLYKRVMQVKFIDRTFNYDTERAYEIIKYLIDNDNGVTNFHFEICADLLDERMLELLGSARKGQLQVEIGIQSTNPETLRAIGRKENVYPVLYNTERLIALGNIHTHVDLIAGLPYESYELFKRSFDKVYSLGADTMQLGFLKVLAGTPMEQQVKRHGIMYRDHAPYEVISTDYISAGELVRLKMIENMLDIFYNRGGFRHTAEYLIEELGLGSFGFYEALADFYYDSGFQNRDRRKDDQYRILLSFAAHAAESYGLPRLEERTRLRLTADAEETMNPENFKRFIRKGWDVTQ